MKGNAFDVFDVVDGQQRLTTLVILLDAIQRAMRVTAPSSELATGVEDRFLKATGRNGQPFYKLSLNADCREYFERNVLGGAPSAEGPTILSHKRLAGARVYFGDWLRREREVRDEGFDDWLVELHDKVTEQLKVSVYVVADEGEVGVIFEVMNDRGKPLSELEKVKNFLLYVGSKLDIDHDLTPTVNNTWRAMLERLMQAGLGQTSSEDRLLRFHWHAVHDHQSKSWSGSRSIKANYRLLRYQDKHGVLLDGLLGYVRSLGDASVAFCDAYEPTRPGAFGRWGNTTSHAAVVEWSRKLLRLDSIAVFMPLLIAARLARPDDHDGYLTLIKACEVYAFRVYRHAQRRSDAGKSTLYGFGGDVHEGKMDLHQAAAAVRKLALEYCSKKRFKEEFAFTEEYDWYHWGGLRYFLYEYEEHLAQGKPVALKWEVVDRRKLADTIEHILPQTTTEEWYQSFDTEARARCLHDIGNLCLTHDNSSYGNGSFTAKRGEPGTGKPCYTNSSLRQERELAQYDAWTEANLLKRRKKLVKWAKQRWDAV